MNIQEMNQHTGIPPAAINSSERLASPTTLRILKPGLAILCTLLGMAVLAAWSPESIKQIIIDYPSTQSVFPPDMAPPTFLWRDLAANSSTWRIEVAFADGAPGIQLSAKGEPMQLGELDPQCVSPTNKPPELTPEEAAAHTWKPDDATWAEIKKHSVTGAATITIRGYADKYSDQPSSEGSMQLRVSADPVGAPIFYRDVPLMPSETEGGVIKPLAASAVPLIDWRIRNVSETSSHVVMHDLHTCANCHSFAANGKTMGMDVDGPQNDKGLYTLVPVRKQMTIRNQDVISWSSFRGESGSPLREGFMSQVSPDGRYVVTTIRPPGVKSSQFYYVANFEDYRFLQVFYPTRGILAWYDSETRKLQPLPGADDPHLVQSNAVWSPDGRYLVFSRAVARSPIPEDGKMASYANDPAEMPMQYDLYRIPFNGGKGGKAEPIVGASQNGMSNSFPKISPDGKWIVYVQARNGQLMRPDGKLYIVQAGGGDARRMDCNTSLMNSWHSFSPNGRWMVFSSKSRSPYTQMFLTHIDDKGNDSPAILIENSTASNRAVNIPEFINVAPEDSIEHIATPAMDFYKQFDVAAELARKGDYNTAIREWIKTLSMDPEDARVRNNYGLTLLSAGRTEEAIAQYRKAIATKPHYSEAQNNLAAALAGSGHSAEAIEHYRLAIADNPDNAEAHSNMGRALAEEGRLPEAIVQFRYALAIRPNYSEAHNNLGVALVKKGDLDEAIDHYREAVRFDTHYADAYNNLGVALAGQGNFSEAAEQFRKTLEVSPNYAGAEANLGRTLLANGNNDEAIIHLDKALASGSDSAELQDDMGIALIGQGKLIDAASHFERALQLDSEFGEAQVDLADIYIRQGQTHKAAALLEKAVRSSLPDVAERAHALLQQLNQQ
jgi:tetratricopeptide (TPR) repeat protein